jgi:lysophospholipase L1-like esterase
MVNRLQPRTLVCGMALLLLGGVAATCPAQEKKESTAVTPMPRDANWVKRHDKFVEMAKAGGIDVLFLGDSITDAWGGEGHGTNSAGNEIFTKEFVPLKATNFGIGGDRTQHVLWRLQNGELNGIQPKVLMLMIGTNNSNGEDNTAEEIAAGVTAVVKEVRQRSPKTKVLLLGIFPRGKDPNDPHRPKIKAVNEIIAKLDDNGEAVKYLDIGDKFLEKDGTLSKEIMPDYLHLTPRGYQIWADAVKGPINDLLGKK